MGDGARLENERAARRLGVRLPPLPLQSSRHTPCAVAARANGTRSVPATFGRVAQGRSTRLLSESMWVQVPPRPLDSEWRWLTACHAGLLSRAPSGAAGSTPAHSADT